MAATTVRRPTTFNKLSEVGEWVKENQGQGRRFALHVDMTTTIIQRRLENAAAKKLMDRAVAKFKARRALRQFRRAAAHIDAAADCMGRGWRDIQEQYAELINPGRTRGGFDWQH